MMMRTLAARTDSTTEALIKGLEQTMMAGFASLGQSVKEVIRDLMRERVRSTSQETPLATSHVLDEAVPTPMPRGRPRSGGPERWNPTIAQQVRWDTDMAAGSMHHRDAFVTEASQQFRAVMR